jgi:hypothetical protein
MPKASHVASSTPNLGDIMSLLREISAKQDRLALQMAQLDAAILGIKSEMKSNYVAYAAMFQEIVASPKV